MKKTICLILSIFFFSAILFSQQDFLFRGLPWYSTPDQIKEKEGQPKTIEEEKNLLWYQYENKEVAGYSTYLEYFMDPYEPYRMFMASYLLDIKKTNLMLQEPDPTSFINAYVDLQGKLISVYGNPKSRKNLDRIEGRISTLMAQQYRSGSPYATAWETGITRVYLLLIYNQKPSSYSVQILYVTKNNWDWVEENLLGIPSKNTDGL